MSYTPMMQQYLKTKEGYPDCILFYRLGDFYEMFFEDALTASKVMEIALTGKSCGVEDKAPMCGVPYHSAETYIAKLIAKGFKVAICEQVEDPATAKGIVKREVVKIITPGTVLNSSMLKSGENNFLLSICMGDDCLGLACTDLSTGEISCGEFAGQSALTDLINEVVKTGAKEILLSDSLKDSALTAFIKENSTAFINHINDHYFDTRPCEEAVERQFGVSSVEGLGLGDMDPTVTALGSLLQYLTETQKQSLSHINNLKIIDNSDHMSLDRATLRNLELTETLFGGEVKGSLLGVLDKTGTAMGSRKMKQWLRKPLNRSDEINRRLDAVEYFTDEFLARNDVRDLLKQVYDLERLAGRLACAQASPRDLISLKRSLTVLPDIKAEAAAAGVPLLTDISSGISDLSEVFDLIDEAILEEPALTIKEGGIIKEGYSADLDEMKLSIKDGREWIGGLEARERERTGIKTLKVGYNKVFGYYIDVSKGNAPNVPDDYIRKQTLVNNERFITPELKEVESVVLGAEAKINNLEYEIFTDLRQRLQGYIKELQSTATALADLDVITSFAEVSSENGYVKPSVNDGGSITIERGRHPVIEQTISEGSFVSNDLYINDSDSSFLLITGPNMAGKSTYMRQNALIVLMAQTGCFVPCDRAEIGVSDRIYTRIGASDNLARGQSTFYVEMSELAGILNTATEKSFIILDEIGRGTSTYDGLSIAWAVTEYLTETRKIRTMFATHYHELTVLDSSLPGLKNLNVDVREEDGTVVFLHKIVEGSANQSYGIHVAKIAGVPESILLRAEKKLDELETESPSEISPPIKSEKPSRGRKTVPEPQELNRQLSLFDFAPNPVIEKLRNLDLMNITPSQAFLILEELKKAAE